MATNSKMVKTNSVSVYINNLKAQLETAKEEKAKKNQNYNRLKEESEMLANKISFLEACSTKLEETNTLAKDVINLIKERYSLIIRMSCNGTLTRKALEILVINTEKIAEEALQLKYLIKKMLDAIEQTGCVLDEEGAISNAINELKTKIETAEAKTIECIQKTLQALQYAITLEAMMGNVDATRGLTKTLREILELIDVNTGTRSIIKFPRDEEGSPRDFYDYILELLEYSKDKKRIVDKNKQLASEALELTLDEINAIESSMEAAENAAKCA